MRLAQEPRQRAVYRRIAENYRVLLRTVTPLLQCEYSAIMVRTGVPITEATFSLKALSIPATECDSMKWDMDFACDDLEDWLFTVQMEGWRATGRISVSD
jgi:hypothetical protein